MAVTVGSNPPSLGSDLVARKVGSLFGKHLELGTKRSLDSMRTTDAHRAFACDLDAAAVDVLTGARFTGWRYVVLHGDEALVEAEVNQTPGGGAWRVASAFSSPLLAEEFRDLTWLAGQPEVGSGDFELCYLRVPAGVVRSWWLRGDSDNRGKDLFLPVQPSAPELRGIKPVLLRPEPFRKAVAVIAQRRLEGGKILLRDVPGFGPG